ncbi:18739_t:CDS:1, partial [Gigaspora rosea]
PHNKQLEEINYNKLSIEEIVDLSNPAFVGSNNPFVNNQSSALDTATKRLSSGNLDYNPILTEDN